jgi:hypothetical protein
MLHNGHDNGEEGDIWIEKEIKAEIPHVCLFQGQERKYKIPCNSQQFLDANIYSVCVFQKWLTKSRPSRKILSDTRQILGFQGGVL